MADSATTRKRLRKQSLGSNTNTWGDTKLNEALDVIDQSIDGWLDIALTGDVTLTTTNYTTADQAKRRAHKFTGTLSAAAAVTYPSVEGWYAVWNAAGAAVTVKLSASTGVTLANGDRALVFSNGTDFFNMAPTVFPAQNVTFAGQLKGVTAGTANTDAVNKTQMETAIATAGLPATAGTWLVSSGDTTAGYGNTKINATGTGAASVVQSVGNPGANETVDIAISVGALGLTDGGEETAGFTAAVNTRYVARFGAAGTITFPASATAGDIIAISYAGYYVYTHNPNGLKINTSTANYPLVGNQTYVWEYTGATDGWV